MSTYLGDKLIAGSFKSGASWEVGDVGISAFGIDESLNKRRYLNGQVISQAQFVSFTDKLKSIVALYPNLATTEVNWQAEATNSKLGQCGKFVIDDTAGTIRLPKVVNINGLQDLALLGGIKAESLPNITGTISSGGVISTYNVSGVFDGSTNGGGNGGTHNSVINGQTQHAVFNASNSSSTYQDNAPVQQEAIQYPYFIQVATGVETSIDVSEQIKLNLPFSLLDYKYSEYELDNASWLISNGQYNSGATYPAVYNLLLAIYNGTTTKAGVSVKLSTEAYADTDFVLNTTDTTFRLPLKVALASGKAVAGNGKILGITDGTGEFGLTHVPNLYLGLSPNTGIDLGASAPTTSPNPPTNVAYGITTDPLKSGIETSANGLYLYFYVGETVQDANIIAVSSILTRMANLSDSRISGLSMPSTHTIQVTIGASGATYEAPANGWFYIYGVYGSGANAYYDLWNTKNGLGHRHYFATNVGSGAGRGYVPVNKGDTVTLNYSGTLNASSTFWFVYAEGEE